MINEQTEVVIYLEKLPIYVSIENQKKVSSTYMSLCILRNKLIESGFVNKENRDNMYFYKKIDNVLLKIKEGEILDGVIYLYIKKEKDYSESSNILFYLEKRIANFEPVFKNLYDQFIINHNSNKEKYEKYENFRKIWNEFKEYNNDSFDYNDWYFIMKQNDISLIRKMSLDIKKWLCQKEKIMAEVDIIYLNDIEYKISDNDFNFIMSYLDDVI
jgi:hypothetical protein